MVFYKSNLLWFHNTLTTNNYTSVHQTPLIYCKKASRRHACAWTFARSFLFLVIMYQIGRYTLKTWSFTKITFSDSTIQSQQTTKPQYQTPLIYYKKASRRHACAWTFARSFLFLVIMYQIGRYTLKTWSFTKITFSDSTIQSQQTTKPQYQTPLIYCKKASRTALALTGADARSQIGGCARSPPCWAPIPHDL